LRRAPAADDPYRALARRLSPALLHQPGDARSQPSPVHAVLQLRATTAWLPRLRPHPGDNLPRRPGSSTLSSCSLWDGESVNTNPSLDSLVDVRSGDARPTRPAPAGTSRIRFKVAQWETTGSQGIARMPGCGD